jgi:hypothetical protein
MEFDFNSVGLKIDTIKIFKKNLINLIGVLLTGEIPNVLI